MNELILHHYESSPFSEKVRLVLGYKGLTWKSVTVPTVLPKPDVVALTGGYRRTPFLQIGGDIYCDTALMCRVIDRLHPERPLYPAVASGMQHILAQWADSALFWCAVPYTLQPAGFAHMFAGAPSALVKTFAADRAAMTANMRRPSIADAHAQVRTYLGWLEQQLASGHKFLCAEVPCIADFSVAHCIWYIHRAPPVAGVLTPFPLLNAWFERMRSLGHGQHEDLSSTEALEIAASARAFAETSFDASQGFAQGEAVTVCATDYASDLIAGALVGLSQDQVSIRRSDERAGTVVVHFPRIGFQVKRDKPV